MHFRSLPPLNRKAAEVLTEFEVHAATDITGFGFAGHSYEMVKGSQAAMEFSMESIPIMKEALGHVQRGGHHGSEHLQPRTRGRDHPV